MLHKTFLSDGSLKLANQKQSLQIFLDGDQSIKDKKRDEINGLVQFLINKDGTVASTYGSGVKPDSPDLISAIEQIL